MRTASGGKFNTRFASSSLPSATRLLITSLLTAPRDTTRTVVSRRIIQPTPLLHLRHYAPYDIVPDTFAFSRATPCPVHHACTAGIGIQAHCTTPFPFSSCPSCSSSSFTPDCGIHLRLTSLPRIAHCASACTLFGMHSVFASGHRCVLRYSASSRTTAQRNS